MGAVGPGKCVRVGVSGQVYAVTELVNGFGAPEGEREIKEPFSPCPFPSLLTFFFFFFAFFLHLVPCSRLLVRYLSFYVWTSDCFPLLALLASSVCFIFCTTPIFYSAPCLVRPPVPIP